jgi:hypothetical protein
MTPARISLGVFALVLASATLPAAAVSQHAAQSPTVTGASTRVTPADFSASRRHVHRLRHAARVHIYRRNDYSFFEPYAPPVPLFFPFGYRRGYF